MRMKRIFFAALIGAMLSVLTLGALALADESSSSLPAGSYTVALPGGGNLGFDVAADGTISITFLPGTLTVASGPTPTDEGFKLTLTDGTTTSLVEVEAESEDGQIQIKAEQEVEEADEDQNEQENAESDDQEVESPEAPETEVESPEPAETHDAEESHDSGDSEHSSDSSHESEGSGGDD